MSSANQRPAGIDVWLEGLGLSAYAAAFHANDVDLDTRDREFLK